MARSFSAQPWAKDGTREGSHRWARSDDTGAFRIRGVDGGEYRISAWKQGHTTDGPLLKAKGGDIDIEVVMKTAEEQPMGLPQPR